MGNNEFIALKSIPNDVKVALDQLTAIIKQRNDPELLMKVGAINGAYAVYERNGDVAILEHLIIDIILLVRDLLTPASPNIHYSFDEVFSKGRTDLIYARTCAEEEVYFVNDLIGEYLDAPRKKPFSDNTRAGYSSGLKRVFEDMGIREIAKGNIRNVVREMELGVRNNPDYNHNIKSAFGGFVKYLLELQ